MMYISYLAISEKRCTIQLSGCNFRCKGCFSKEKYIHGKKITGKKLAKYIPSDKQVMIAGGEPTIYRYELISFISELKRDNIILSTNGSLLDENFIKLLKGITIHIDLKALNPDLHIWYTGKDNDTIISAIKLLYENNFDFEVSTVYIPEVIDYAEIENISKFLSNIGDIKYKIMRYIPVNNFSKRPDKSEIEKAVKIAKRYLRQVSSSIESRKIINL